MLNKINYFLKIHRKDFVIKFKLLYKNDKKAFKDVVAMSLTSMIFPFILFWALEKIPTTNYQFGPDKIFFECLMVFAGVAIFLSYFFHSYLFYSTWYNEKTKEIKLRNKYDFFLSKFNKIN